MEAMHYRYHPLTQRLAEVVGELGPVRHIQAWTSFAIPTPATSGTGTAWPAGR